MMHEALHRRSGAFAAPATAAEGCPHLHICAVLAVSRMRPCARRRGDARSGRVSARRTCAPRRRAGGTLVAMTNGIDLRTCSWMK